MNFYILYYNYFNNYNIKYKNIIKNYKLYMQNLDYLLNHNICINIIYLNNYKNKCSNYVFNKIIYNFYNTDIFCKLSSTLSLMALKINYKSYI